MAEILLDGQELTAIEEVHDRFARGMDLPGYYGRNLDALFDCLSEWSRDVTIRLLHQEALEEALGRRGQVLIRLLRRAAAENSHIVLLEE